MKTLKQSVGLSLFCSVYISHFTTVQSSLAQYNTIILLSYLDTNYIKLLDVILTSTGLLLVHVNHLDLSWSHTETRIKSGGFNEKNPNRNFNSELFHLFWAREMLECCVWWRPSCRPSHWWLVSGRAAGKRRADTSSFLAWRRQDRHEKLYITSKYSPDKM